MRGKDLGLDVPGQTVGITPACAGKSSIQHLTASLGEFEVQKVIRSFTCGSACRSGRIIPGISAMVLSSTHHGQQAKAVGFATAHALTQQVPERLGVRHLQNALIRHRQQ